MSLMQTEANDCAAPREMLNRIGDKWSLYIMDSLTDGPRRFGELKREVQGISQRMLTLTLKGLEKDGLITRTARPTIPPRVDYELTSLGYTLLPPVVALIRWANLHRAEIVASRVRYVQTSGRSIANSPLFNSARSECIFESIHAEGDDL